MDREPLGAFPPVLEGDGRTHASVVPATTRFSRIIEGAEEAELGVGEVVVNAGEVEEWNAGFRDEDKPPIRPVEQGVCKEAPLCIDHRWPAPFYCLFIRRNVKSCI